MERGFKHGLDKRWWSARSGVSLKSAENERVRLPQLAFRARSLLPSMRGGRSSMSIDTLASATVGSLDCARDEPTVVNCYALFDKFFPTVGLLDYSEGMYFGDASTPLEIAQLNQI